MLLLKRDQELTHSKPATKVCGMKIKLLDPVMRDMKCQAKSIPSKHGGNMIKYTCSSRRLDSKVLSLRDS